jgi:hypothetical protein
VQLFTFLATGASLQLDGLSLCRLSEFCICCMVDVPFHRRERSITQVKLNFCLLLSCFLFSSFFPPWEAPGRIRAPRSASPSNFPPIRLQDSVHDLVNRNGYFRVLFFAVCFSTRERFPLWIHCSMIVFHHAVWWSFKFS